MDRRRRRALRRVSRSGADIVSPPQLRIYGVKEFEAWDLDGNVICFGQDMSLDNSARS